MRKKRRLMSEYKNGLASVRALYDEYISEVEKLEYSKKPTDGLLGFGKKSSDDSCHDFFSKQLKKTLENYAEEKPDSSDISIVLEYIYSIQNEHKDLVSAYWLMKAAHGFTEELVGMLSREDASKLYEFYDKIIPRRDRFPVQKKILKALKMATK